MLIASWISDFATEYRRAVAILKFAIISPHTDGRAHHVSVLLGLNLSLLPVCSCLVRKYIPQYIAIWGTGENALSLIPLSLLFSYWLRMLRKIPENTLFQLIVKNFTKCQSWKSLLGSLSRWGNWGPERQMGLSKVTQWRVHRWEDSGGSPIPVPRPCQPPCVLPPDPLIYT